MVVGTGLQWRKHRFEQSQKAVPWAKSPTQTSFLSSLFIIAAGFLKSMNKQTRQRLSPGDLEKDLVAPISPGAAVGRGWMEGSCVQTRGPFARPASGGRRAGQVPSTVKGNISANVGTRDGVDLVSAPKGHQVALKRRKKRGTLLLSGMEWRDKLGNYPAHHTMWVLAAGARSVNPGPGVLMRAAHSMHGLGAWIPWLLMGCMLYISGSPCAPHYGFSFHFCTVLSIWLLNSYTQQQPRECGADQRLWHVGKVWASTAGRRVMGWTWI